MMGERRVDQGALFYEFSLERHLPSDHLLRRPRLGAPSWRWPGRSRASKARPTLRAASPAMSVWSRAVRASTSSRRDGNFTAALGIPTLGGLGPDGPGAHAAYEQIYFSSLMPCTYLCARLLETLDLWSRSTTRPSRARCAWQIRQGRRRR